MKKKCSILPTSVSKKILTWLIIMIIGIICFGITGNKVPFIQKDNHIQPRGIIVTLIHGDNRSVLLTINMIHSVVKFHTVENHTFYPFLIFHENDFSPAMREHILSCTIKHNTHLNISFAIANFETSARPDNKSRLNKPLGYRLMCRFWTYDIFYHPAITRGGYEYLMRMDADSYFPEATNKDLFIYIDRQKLDYVYRDLYWEPITPMEPILEHFLYDTSDVSQCIYNNFFIMRLKWFYESQLVQTFVNELVRDDLMIREYIGDGCAHAAMLKIDKRVKVKHITDIAYGHNYHIMSRRKGVMYLKMEQFEEEIKNACEQLTVLRGGSTTLTRIHIS